MDRRDRLARQYVKLPTELVTLIEMVRIQHHFSTKNATVRWLIETHPAIASVTELIYNAARQETPAGS